MSTGAVELLLVCFIYEPPHLTRLGDSAAAQPASGEELAQTTQSMEVLALADVGATSVYGEAAVARVCEQLILYHLLHQYLIVKSTQLFEQQIVSPD